MTDISFRYTIAYVRDVGESLTFFVEAFGFLIRFRDESGTYGELDTGQTILAFAADSLGEANFPGDFARNRPDEDPVGVEIGLTTEDVPAAVAAAVAAGGSELSPPKEMPWGQTVAWIRDPNGVLVELGTPHGP